MAKRKRKKSTKKQKLELKVEVYAVLLIIISIIGLGKLGPVGRFFASFSVFATGSAYMVTLVLLLIIGIYTFFKGEWPEFLSTKFLGFYMLAIGLLTFMHWDFISQNDGNSSLIFRETLNELSKGFNSLMQTGTISESITIGGGFIGGIFALLFSKVEFFKDNLHFFMFDIVPPSSAEFLENMQSLKYTSDLKLFSMAPPLFIAELPVKLQSTKYKYDSLLKIPPPFSFEEF